MNKYKCNYKTKINNNKNITIDTLSQNPNTSMAIVSGDTIDVYVVKA